MRAILLGAFLLGVVGCTGRPAATATPPPPIGPDVAALQVGQHVRVRMQVECAEPGVRDQPTYLKPDCYFQGHNFRVGLKPGVAEQLERTWRTPPEIYLIGRLVDAQGVVQRNGPWSEILIEAPDQIRLATGFTPPKEPTRVAPKP